MKEPFRKTFTKRGQVTLFIIAGALILFAAFLVGYLQNESFRQKIESQLFGAAVVPEQAKGVVGYVNNCIERIARDGIEILGFQGGYIDISNSIGFNSRAYLQADTLTKVPYWVYGRGNVVIPTIQDTRTEKGMETQLEEYIDRRFNAECNFDEFLDYEFSTKQIKSEAEILSGKVFVKLKSEINVEIKESTFTISDYIGVDIPIDLRMLYDMAVDIVERELRTTVLGNAPFEAATVDLIAAYAKDKDSLLSIPPIAGISYECNPDTWTLDEVRKNIETYLGIISRLFRVDGVDNEEREEFYNSLVIDDVFSREYNDISVNFNYDPGWIFYLDVYPKEGRVLKPSTLKFGLPFIPLFCFTNYNFRYTLQYPLMVNIEKDGFTFRFPIELYIVDNFGGRLIDEGSVNVETERSGLFCDKNQRLSGIVSVESINALTGEALEDVEVIYTCGVNSCVIGKTKTENGRAFLTGKFPLCKGGEIILSKENYGEFSQQIDTLNVGKNSVPAYMKPYINKKVEVRVVEIGDDGFYERELRDNEVANVQFTVLDVAKNSFKDRFGLVFNGNEIQETPLLLDEQYNVVVNLRLYEEVTIPSGKFNGVDVPEQRFDSLFIGGADFEKYIGLEDLQKDKVVVLVLSNGVPENFEDYVNNLDVKELTQRNLDKVGVRFE